MSQIEFIAKYKDGIEETITIETSASDIRKRTNGSSKIDGLKTLRIKRNGEPVNRIKKGKYKTLDGDILASDAPNAP